jgi:2-oxoisovalerate dehydrogenase E1 component
VIDARSIAPLNYDPILESIDKTGRIVLVSDACERGSYLHTIASTITQTAFSSLDAPPVVVGARNWITPPDEIEDAFFPYSVDIIDAVHEQIVPLPGREVTRKLDRAEILRRAKLGV